ncbi:MAG: DUF559 domain-containing protein [Pseudolabrys sp.]
MDGSLSLQSAPPYGQTEVDGVTHSSTSEIARDTARTELLEAFGYHVVRVSNTDVYENLAGVLDMIDQTLHPR